VAVGIGTEVDTDAAVTAVNGEGVGTTSDEGLAVAAIFAVQPERKTMHADIINKPFFTGIPLLAIIDHLC